jgi:hypothetical protein
MVGRSLPPVEAFFCGLGGADVSPATWREIARATLRAADHGHPECRWRILHDGVEIAREEI